MQQVLQVAGERGVEPQSVLTCPLPVLFAWLGVDVAKLETTVFTSSSSVDHDRIREVARKLKSIRRLTWREKWLRGIL